MSQNPAHTPRRALSPPAVTRFQLRTASASEAVFSPPYVPPRPAGTPSVARPAGPAAPTDTFPEPIIRQKPPALPPPTRSRELPRPPASTRAFELPPPLPPVPEPPPAPPPPDRPETVRSEPGTWREIIARFERDIDEVPDARSPAGEAATEGRVAPPHEPEPVDTTGPSPPASSGDERVLEEPSLDIPVAWEVEGMTTPDYQPTHSIHDAEHDSWPVDADVGDAVPAWSDDADDEADDDARHEFDEIGELLLDEVVPVDPWDVEAEPDERDDVRSEFPLDAFIVPAGVQNVGGYDDEDVARQVAHRLDELARQLRAGGLRSLCSTDSVDELSRVLAAIVTGFLARHG